MGAALPAVPRASSAAFGLGRSILPSILPSTVDPTIAYDIHDSSIFGEVRMPDHSMTAMGRVDYRGPGTNAPRVHLRLNALFACQVVESARRADSPRVA